MNLDLDKIHKFDVLVEGQRVHVTLDEKGNPLTVSGGVWLGGDREKNTVLAIEYARAQQKLATARHTKDVNNETRTSRSAEERRKAATEHWSNGYLQRAHEQHPDFGADRLATAARKLAAEDGVADAGKRDEITVYRAKQHLNSVKKPRTT